MNDEEKMYESMGWGDYSWLRDWLASHLKCIFLILLFDSTLREQSLHHTSSQTKSTHLLLMASKAPSPMIHGHLLTTNLLAFGWAYVNNWHNTWEQFYVYWICPFIGAILAAWVFRVLFPPATKQKKA
ncbi:hypothetical protein L1049_008204 [Liquidambar formosana]|uniref:Uncharacterized protein n=1 Tax=Liquidambar formosana TaxID=63359 RepID=A0AAP0S9G9_LIQFO